MKMQLTLNDATLDLVVAQLQPVLEAPYFMHNGRKFAGGKVTVHRWKDMFIGREKRPMIHFAFNGSYGYYFCEGDTVISYGTDKVIVKGKDEKIFTKATVTAKEAKKTVATERMNKEYEEKCEKAYWADVKADWEREIVGFFLEY